MARSVSLLLLMAVALAQPQPIPSPAIHIPKPSGPFAIGRVTYDWVDPARPEVLSAVPGTHREIVVDVWYPAAPPKPGARPAPYLPDAEKIDKSGSAQLERSRWGKVWPMIVSGSLRSHVYENAPIAPHGTPFPMIIFSHGYGIEPLGYTVQIEQMVSYGYVVTTIHHVYEVAVTVFPDGRVIPFSVQNGRGAQSRTIEEMRKWAEPRIDVWAADIRFALDQITRLASAPFGGSVDLGDVGVFGHSFGGVAVGRACELDQRIKACLNQDGSVDDRPILLYEAGRLPSQPYLYLRSARWNPPDDQLKAAGITRTDFEKGRVEANAADEAQLRGCSGGAYQVRIQIPGFEHMSFADFSLLLADSPEERAQTLRKMRLAESYTLAFFDKFLKGAHNTLLDREPADGSGIEIKRYSR